MLLRIERGFDDRETVETLRCDDVAVNEKLVFLCSDVGIRTKYSGTTDVQAILDGIKGRPGQRPDNIENGFVWLLYSRPNRKLYFGNDAFGFGKLYYACTSDRLYLSDSISQLVDAMDTRLNIDYTAWAEFLSFSYLLGDRTFFLEIKTICPDAYIKLSFADWKPEQETGFSLKSLSEDGTIEYGTAVQTCADLLRQSVERAVPSDETGVLLPLSGGYDSRCLAGLLRARHGSKNISCVTFSMDDGSSGDILCAEKTAEFLGVDQTVYELDEDYFSQELPSYPERVNYESGMYVDFGAFLKKLSATYPKGTVLLDGYGGDRLLRVARLAQVAEERGTEAFYEAFFQKNASKRVDRCTDSRNRAELKFLAKQGLVEELKRCGDNITVFYLYNRNARNMSYALRLEGDGFSPLAPFMDWNLICYSLTLPGSIRGQQSFYTDILNTILPGLGDLPSTNDQGVEYPHKPLVVDTPRWKRFMQDSLGDYWEAIGGVYDAELICREIEELSGSGINVTSVFSPSGFTRNGVGGSVISSLTVLWVAFLNRRKR